MFPRENRVNERHGRSQTCIMWSYENLRTTIESFWSRIKRMGFSSRVLGHKPSSTRRMQRISLILSQQMDMSTTQAVNESGTIQYVQRDTRDVADGDWLTEWSQWQMGRCSFCATNFFDLWVLPRNLTKNRTGSIRPERPHIPTSSRWKARLLGETVIIFCFSLWSTGPCTIFSRIIGLFCKNILG